MDFYAIAVALTELHPDQVNNEVRNAVAHLGRALSADSPESAQSQLRQARNHVSRAKRDAIKLAVLELHDRIQDVCAEISAVYGSIDIAYLVRRDTLTSKRKELLRAEINGDDNVVEGYVEMFNMSDELESDLIRDFHLKQKRISRFERLLHRLKRQVLGVAAGVAIGLAASALFAVFFPDTTAFGNHIRQWLGMPVVPLSSPGTGGAVGTAANRAKRGGSLPEKLGSGSTVHIPGHTGPNS